MFDCILFEHILDWLLSICIQSRSVESEREKERESARERERTIKINELASSSNRIILNDSSCNQSNERRTTYDIAALEYDFVDVTHSIASQVNTVRPDDAILVKPDLVSVFGRRAVQRRTIVLMGLASGWRLAGWVRRWIRR